MARAPKRWEALPGPKPTSLFGWRSNLQVFRRDPLLYLQHLHHEYPAVAAIVQGRLPIIAVFSPDLFEDLLAQPGMLRSAAWPIAPRGSVAPHHLHTWYQQIFSVTQDLLARWVPGQLVDIVYVARRIMLRSAVPALFGVDLAAEDIQRLRGLLDPWIRQTLALPRPVFGGGVAGRYARSNERGQAAFDHAIGTVVKKSAPGALVPQLFDPQHAVRGGGLLLALLYETTALAIGWTMLLLAQHVGVLHDLRDELRTKLNGAPPTYAQLIDPAAPMALLQGVVYESLRMLPPVGVGVCTSTAAWHQGSVDLPAGSTFVYSPYLLQRMQTYYYAPDRFRPQRWAQIEPPAAGFMPLGAEPLAMHALPMIVLGVKLVVTLLLQHYQFTPAPGAQIDRARMLLLAPRHDLPLVILPADRPPLLRDIGGNIHDLVYLPSSVH